MHYRLAERRNQIRVARETSMRDQVKGAMLALEVAELRLLRAGANGDWEAGRGFLLRLVDLRHKMRTWMTNKLAYEIGQTLLQQCEQLADDMRAEMRRLVG